MVKKLNGSFIVWDTRVKMDNELCKNIIKATNRVKLQVMIPYLDEYVEYSQEDLSIGTIILYDKL